MLAILSVTTTAGAQSRAFVEIGETDEQLNPTVLRRLVALELSDIAVPESPHVVADGQEVTLHCRVLLEEGELRVEVWARGESAGTRRVSMQGTPALVARRVALAAAELARRLAHMRQAEARRLEREAAEAEQAALVHAERKQRERLALIAQARAVGFTEGAYFAGPSVGAQLNGDHPLRVEFSVGWMAGQLTELAGRPAWSALELRAAPGWVVPLGPTLDLALGLPVSAGVVGAGEAAGSGRGRGDRWLMRGGVEARFQPRLSPRLRFDMGLAGGAILRPLLLEEPIEGARAERHLSGLWAELTIGVLLD